MLLKCVTRVDGACCLMCVMVVGCGCSMCDFLLVTAAAEYMPAAHNACHCGVVAAFVSLLKCRGV